MTTVRETIKQIGLGQSEAGDLVLFRMAPKSKPVHYLLDDIGDDDLDRWPDLRMASGLFRHGAIVNNQGRRGENLVSVETLLFDADLADYLEIDKQDRTSRQELFDSPQEDIDANIRALRTTLDDTFHALDIPIHRLDYTGHGLCASIYLRDASAEHLDIIKDAHKALILKINEACGFELVDAQSSDSGTRGSRVPGTLNTKGKIHRRVETIAASWKLERRLTVGDIVRLAGTSGTERVRAVHPQLPADRDVSGNFAEAIVAAILPQYTEGKRHLIVRGLTGMLRKAGVKREHTEAIIDALCVNDDEPGDRRAAIRTAYDAGKSFSQLRGYHDLKECLTPEALAFVDERINQVRTANAVAPRLIAGGKSTRDRAPEADDDAPKITTYPTAPDEAYYGWFAAYRDVMAPTTEAPDCFHLGAAITLAGAMVGRKVWTKYASDQLYPNFYSLLIGASGSSRKDTAIKRAIQLPQVAMSTQRLSSPPFAIRRDISSGEGLVAILKEEPNILLYISELTTMLRNIKRESTKSLGDKLIEAWDTPSTLQNLNKQSPIYAVNPYLSIISGTQPGRLEEEMTDTEINSGFGNRWMFFAGSAKPKVANPPDVDERAAANLYIDLQDAIRFYGDDQCLRLTKDAQPRWDAWYLADNIDEHDEDRQAMRIRHATLIQKTALLFAITDTSSEIEDQHLAGAIALVEWMWTVVQQLMPTWGSTIDRKIEERILRQLRRNGPLPRRTLQQYTSNRKWSARDFASVFRAMQENGSIQVDAAGTVMLPNDHRMRGVS